MWSFPKILIAFGLIITFTGIVLYFGVKIGLPFFKMPGDIHIEKGKYSIYFPIVTTIFLSIFLTRVINFILWVMHK